MKAVFVTYHYLDVVGGGSLASRAYLNAFSKIADNLMVMYPERGDPKTFLPENCIGKGIPDYRSNLKKGLDLLSGKIHRSSHLASVIISFNPDLVIFDNSVCSAGLIKKIKKRGIKIITIHHNYMIEYFKGTKPLSKDAPNFLVKLFMYLIKKTEKESIFLSDINLTLTDDDIQLLYKNYDPNKISKIKKIGCFEYTTFKNNKLSSLNPSLKKKNLTFVITGTLGAHQTEVSLINFIESYYDILLSKLPGSQLIIAGRAPSHKIQELCKSYSSIQLIANPEDINEIILKADIYICPISIGGGLKLRVMDGLKAGLPILTHEVSARGYEDFINENCLFVYKDKNSFSRSLDSLIVNIDEGNINKSKIINSYIKLFSFDAGLARLKTIVSENLN